MAADRRAAQERLSDLQSRMAALSGPGAAADEALGLGATLEEAAAVTGGVAAAARRAAAPPGAAAPPSRLRALAEAARAAGRAVFTWPEDGAPVGGAARLFYDRCAGPLPRDARPRIKAGLNLWEEVVVADMARADELAGLDGHEWWELEVQLPEDLFRWARRGRMGRRQGRGGGRLGAGAWLRDGAGPVTDCAREP
jgi:hypothetical protein